MTNRVIRTDQGYLVLHQGDRQTLTFDLPLALADLERVDVTVVAARYYVPLE